MAPRRTRFRQANPFAAGGGRAEIFAIGLRNPWRFSFDRVTGDLYIGDVGQGSMEEIDFLPRGQGAGANFGWRIMEGNQCTNLGGGLPCNAAAFTPPVLAYDHSQGCSVTGGVVYRGRNVPVLYGHYLYGDYCSGRMWAAARDRNGVWQTEELLETGHRIGTFGEDNEGEVYWSDLSSGAIHRFGCGSGSADRHRVLQCDVRPLFPDGFAEEAAALDGGAFAGAWGAPAMHSPCGTSMTQDASTCAVTSANRASGRILISIRATRRNAQHSPPVRFGHTRPLAFACACPPTMHVRRRARPVYRSVQQSGDACAGEPSLHG